MSDLNKELFPEINDDDVHQAAEKEVCSAGGDTVESIDEVSVVSEENSDANAFDADTQTCPEGEAICGDAIDSSETDANYNVNGQMRESAPSAQQRFDGNAVNVQPPMGNAYGNNAHQHASYAQQPHAAQQQYMYPGQTPAPAKKKKSKGKAVFAVIACVAVITALALFAASLIGNGILDNNVTSGVNDTDVPKVSLVEPDEEGLSAAEVYQKVFKSSVSVLAYSQSSGELEVLGSGIVCQVDNENKYTYIATCAHVISDPSYNLKVELWDGSVYTAEVVGFDATNDIGAVRIHTTGLTVAEFASSDDIQPGATVYAIGSPYSSKFAGTFTRGMVSATNRLVTTQTNYQISCIQHDAPINNGNSGGALLNANGQVVGINALKINSGGYEGLGFAVPSKTVLKVVNSVIETGVAPKTPILGISYVQATYYSQFLSDLIEENGLPAGAILVAEITDNSSLKNSELKVNDIIISVDGDDLNAPDLLVQKIQNSSVGDKMVLSVVRIVMNEDGTDYVELEYFDVTATLVEKTEESANSEEEDKEDFYNYFGEDSGDYEDFYNYFYDYFYGQDSNGNNEKPKDDKHFTIPGE